PPAVRSQPGPYARGGVPVGCDGDCVRLARVDREHVLEPRDREDLLQLLRQTAQPQRAAAIVRRDVRRGQLRYAGGIDVDDVLEVDDEVAGALVYGGAEGAGQA